MAKQRSIALSFLGLVLIMTSLASGSPADSQSAVRKVLDNGLTVIVKENKANPVVAIQVWVKVGSADEQAGEEGLAHVFEHMLFKGTNRRQVGEIAREIESSGGDINAHTSYDQTVYKISIPSDSIDLGLDIMADALFNSSFDNNELEREKEVILEEFRRGQDNPSRQAMEGLLGTSFKVHPYGRPIIGKEETIRDLTRDHLVEFFKRWYRPDNMVAVVVGDVSADEVVDKISALFRVVPPSGQQRPDSPTEPPQEEFRLKNNPKESNQVYFELGFPIPGVSDPLVHRYDLLSQILGGTENSRLWRRLKEEKALVNTIWSYSFTPRDTGLFIIGCVLDPNVSLEEVATEVLGQLSQVSKDLSDEEVGRAAVNIESDFVYQREKVEGEASGLGFFEVVVGDLEAREAYLDMVRGAAAGDLKTLAEKLFSPQNLTVSVVAPPGFQSPDEDRFRDLAVAALPSVSPPLSAGLEKPAAMVNRFVLPNGLKVLIRRRNDVPVISYRAAFLGGLRFDPQGAEGLSYLTSQTLVKGSESYSREELLTLLDETASSLDPFSGNNSFGLTLTTLSRFQDRTLPALVDTIVSPLLPAEEFEKDKISVLRELKGRRDNLIRSTLDLLAKTFFGSHPYSRPAPGTKESIEKITRDRIVGFYRRYARPDNMVLAVVGDVDPDSLKETLEKAFGSWNPGPVEFPEVPPQTPLTSVVQADESRDDLFQAHLAIGFPGPAIGDPDRYPMEVLNAVLTGQGGRLFTELRDRQSLAYSVASFPFLGVDPGYLGVYIGLSPEKIPAAEKGILDEIDRLTTEPVGAEDLDRAKNYLIGQRVISGQSNSFLAGELAFAELYGLGIDSAFNYPDLIREVTPEDIQRVARRYLSPKIYAEAILKPR